MSNPRHAERGHLSDRGVWHVARTLGGLAFVFAIASSCASVPAQSAAGSEPARPTEAAQVSPVAVRDEVRCEEPLPVGEPPLVLLELSVPRPPTAPPSRPRRGGRRVIVLDCMDCIEDTNVVRVAPDGQAVTLGLGVDPRLLPDGSFVYVEALATPEQALVHVAQDGSLSRTPGGTTRAAGFGAMLPVHRAPRSPDGRWQLWPHESCFEDAAECQLELYRHDLGVERRRVTSVPFAMSGRSYHLGLASDGSAFSGCVGSDSHGEGGAWLWVDVASGESSLREVSTRCLNIDMRHQRALGAEGPTVTVYDRRGGRVVVEASVVPETVQLSPCGDAVFVTGRREPQTSEPQANPPLVVERVSLAGGAPVLLATLPTGPNHDEVLCELDERGWLMVLSTRQHEDPSVWLVPTGGTRGPVAVTLPPGRVHMATLGPARAGATPPR